MNENGPPLPVLSIDRHCPLTLDISVPATCTRRAYVLSRDVDLT